MPDQDHSFLAIDWGTTNRRIYRIENGAVVQTERDGLGVKAVTDFDQEVQAVRARFGDLPIIAAGMIGSSIGWHEAPYVPTPADAKTLADNLLYVDDRTMIVPGVATRDDVMRGEEVQLLGACAAGFAPPDAVLLQPGTHCKWAEMRGGAIASFTTAMTGELFALLQHHSLLASQFGSEPATPGPAFQQGLEESRGRDLTASLFRVRAAKMLGLRDDADVASYVSGLLIGADIVARIEDIPFDTAYILADAELGALYQAALSFFNRSAILVDSHAGFVAGILEVRKYIS